MEATIANTRIAMIINEIICAALRFLLNIFSTLSISIMNYNLKGYYI